MTWGWALRWEKHSENALFSLFWQGKYWRDPLARQRVLCATHTVKNRSVKTWVGSDRRGVAWSYSKPWLLEDVGMTGFIWGKGVNRTEKTVQPTGIVSNEVEILGWFFVHGVWAPHFAVFYSVSPLHYASHACWWLWRNAGCCVTSLSIGPHRRGRRTGGRSWAAGKAATLTLKLLTWSTLNASVFSTMLDSPSPFSPSFPAEPVDFRKLFFIPLPTERQQTCAMKKHFPLACFLTAFFQPRAWPSPLSHTVSLTINSLSVSRRDLQAVRREAFLLRLESSDVVYSVHSCVLQWLCTS